MDFPLVSNLLPYWPPLFISLNSNLNETVIVANQPTFMAYRNNKTVIINFNGTYANSGDNITLLIGEENLPCSFGYGVILDHATKSSMIVMLYSDGTMTIMNLDGVPATQVCVLWGELVYFCK